MKTIVVLPHRLSGRLQKKYMQSSFQIERTQLGLAAVIIITIFLIIHSSSYRWRWETLEWTIFLDKPRAPCANPGLSHLVLLCLQFQFPFSRKPMAFSPEYILTHSTSFIVGEWFILFIFRRAMGCIQERVTKGMLSPGRNVMRASTTVTKTWSWSWNYKDITVKLMR